MDVPSDSDAKLRQMVRDLARMKPERFATPDIFAETLRGVAKRYRMMPSKWELGKVYRALVQEGELKSNAGLGTALIQKAVRSASGILNISVSMPPDTFSCKHNCHFCPNEPGMPRSYLSNEDVFKRAARVGFDTVGQVHTRLRALEINGHTLDKIEFRVLGGTFSSYEHTVADTFIRDLYYAANTYGQSEPRARGSLEDEQEHSASAAARVHVVGLGVETRPDAITHDELRRFRRYGVTRVEMGVQHTDDALLRRLNRGHGLRQSKAAIRLLKDYGFKVEIHIMTDLPGATPAGDMDCYRQVLRDDPDLVPDYMKDYPCLDVDFTEIKRWKADGRWTPYAERDVAILHEVLIYRQAITPKWVRVNRVQRDFQEAGEGRLGFTSETIHSNLGQIVTAAAEARGIYCQCIRCCEISNESFDMRAIRYTVHPVWASGSQEYFICAEILGDKRDLLLGFIRLRISRDTGTVCGVSSALVAMIRELHVYGQVKAVGSSNGHGAQHLGIGRTLLGIAETLAQRHGATRIAVISGIGVRGYYQKHGYTLQGTYMVKSLPLSLVDLVFCMCMLLCLAGVWLKRLYA